MGIFGEPDSVFNWAESCWVTRISISCIFEFQHSGFHRTIVESDAPSCCWCSIGLVSTSITFFGKCWFLVYQPTWLWLQSWPVSGFFWCLVGQLLARQLSNIISYFLASASSASLTHRELTTPTLCRTARSTSLTEAKSKTRESFSFSFVGKAFYSISQLLKQNSKRQWVRRLMTKIIWFVGSSRIWSWVQIWVGFISPSLSHLKVSIQPKEATQLLTCCQWGQALLREWFIPLVSVLLGWGGLPFEVVL